MEERYATRKGSEQESSGSQRITKLSGGPQRSEQQQAFMAGLSSLPLGHFLAQGGTMAHFGARQSGGKGSAKGRGGKKDHSVAVGNDERTPWARVPPPRSVTFHLVAGRIETGIVLTQSTTLNTYASYQFTIAGLTEFASWSVVFDQYRIVAIEALVEFPMNESTSLTADPGRYVSVIDVDDATVPTNLDTLCAYSQAVESSVSQPHYHRWAPGVAVDLYTGAFGGFGNVTSPWIDCGSSSVVHYGLKFGSTPAAVAGTLRITWKYHVEFRATH